MNKPDKLTVTFVGPYNDDVCVATVSHVTPWTITILNQFYGKNAEELYKQLTGEELENEEQAEAAEKLTEAKIIKMFQDVTHLSIADSGWFSRCIADEKIKSLSDIQAFLERLARW